MGGIPCQSFSTIGPRSGYGLNNEKFEKDHRDTLYRYFAEIVAHVRPKVVLIENVKGILSKKDASKRKIIDLLLAALERAGYSFETKEGGKKYQILNSADYGVPQRRERVFLIGVSKKMKKTAPIVPRTHFNPKTNEADDPKSDELLPYVTLGEAIFDLPEVSPKITFTDLDEKEILRITKINAEIKPGSDRVELDETRFKAYITKLSPSGKRFFEFVRPNGYKYVDYHVARSHQLSDIRLFRLLREGETASEFIERSPVAAEKLIKYGMSSFKDKYRKQASDDVSTTIFAHLSHDGNRFIHPRQARTLTPREAARIQSFPDDFVFEGSNGHKFWQIGNAVPPLVGYNIAKSTYCLFSDSNGKI